jgi:hypothetical protein
MFAAQVLPTRTRVAESIVFSQVCLLRSRGCMSARLASPASGTLVVRWLHPKPVVGAPPQHLMQDITPSLLALPPLVTLASRLLVSHCRRNVLALLRTERVIIAGNPAAVNKLPGYHPCASQHPEIDRSASFRLLHLSAIF